MLKVKVKVKVKESALVNVDKNRCSLQINTLRCKLLYTIVNKVRNVNAVSAWLLEIGRSGNYCVVQQKIHLFSATNYTANLYSATIVLDLYSGGGPQSVSSNIRSTERLVVVIIRFNFTQLRKEELIEKLA